MSAETAPSLGECDGFSSSAGKASFSARPCPFSDIRLKDNYKKFSQLFGPAVYTVKKPDGGAFLCAVLLVPGF